MPWMYMGRVGACSGIIVLVGSAAEEDEIWEPVEERIQPGVTVTLREVGPRYGLALRGRMCVGRETS